MMEFLKSLRSFDLNLLAVFIAIEENRNITKAAQTLGLTQPALSHALARLRVLLGDPLFVKSSQGMVPTPRAEQLAEPIRELLEKLGAQLSRGKAFDPKVLSRLFCIHTTDLIESLLLPQLLPLLVTEAPLSQVVTRPTLFSLPKLELESGKSDLAIGGFFGDLPEGFYQQKLYRDVFLSAVRRSHPRLGKAKKLSLDAYCQESHLLIAPGGELSAKMDGLLKAKGKRRHIVAGLQSFTSSAWILSNTDTILTAPSRLIRQLEKAFPLTTFEPPLPIPEVHVVQVWHERNHADAAHRWFREKTRDCLQSTNLKPSN